MNLERFRGRALVLPPTTTAKQAAEALAARYASEAVVEDHDRALGIVTERDLALRVLGRGLSPDRVSVGQVMTPDLVTLHPSDTEEAAAALMRSLAVRRVPLVDLHDKTVGLVTLDDLLTSHVPAELLAQVVEAQKDAAPASGPKVRARQSLHDFEDRLKTALELDSRERALTAFCVVASAIVRRLEPPQAHDFISQLPALVRELLYQLPPGPDRRVTSSAVDDQMAKALRLPVQAAARLVDKVAAALPLFVSEVELEDVRARLPWRLRRLIRLAA